MSLLKIRKFSQVTIPADLRKRFDLAEGDYLEAEAVKGGILLKPVTVVDREKAWKQVFEASDEVQDLKPKSKESLEAQEKKIAKIVKAARK